MAQSHPNGEECADSDVPCLWWMPQEGDKGETWTVCSGCQFVYAVVPGHPLRHPLGLLYQGTPPPGWSLRT